MEKRRLGQSDLELTTIGLEGRSTATTMLSLSILRYLRAHGEQTQIPEKLPTFTDNRQDASLQAGHLNDFVLVALVRAAVFSALNDAKELDQLRVGLFLDFQFLGANGPGVRHLREVSQYFGHALGQRACAQPDDQEQRPRRAGHH